MSLKKIILKKNEERRVNAGHLWIYSNEIDTKRSPLKQFEPGEIVEILSSKASFLAIGYVNPHALISVRILTKSPQVVDKNFFKSQIKLALKLREQYFTKPFYRLVFGESDLLPGLIIDRYGDVFVVQTNTAGMEHLKEEILLALREIFAPQCIVLKNDSSMRHLEGLETYVIVAHGELKDTLLEENNFPFHLNILEGQKTGWFYDHRDNRARLDKYVKNKTVLDVFSYMGGFGIHAANYGAKEVFFIDSSPRAIQAVKENAKLNHCEDKIHCLEGDVFSTLKSLIHEKKHFDVIILDPPALIKKRKDIEEGVIAYLRLNELAMQLLNQDGILVSCSCSLHMPQAQLIDIVRRASIKSRKKTQILQIGFQGVDHPVHPAIPETAYLKALFCLVHSEKEL